MAGDREGSEKVDSGSIIAMAFKSLADNSKTLHLYLRNEAAIGKAL